jgi:NodT family efflux transporter outer membrane factor (OMF) lipoprotein
MTGSLQPSSALGQVVRQRALAFLLAGCVVAVGCDYAPKYAKPPIDSGPAYKELTPENFKEVDGWRVAAPSDEALKGKWWEIFNDPQLNKLEEQVNVSNQSIASAAASFLAARALVREARAQLFPTVSVNPSITQARSNGGSTPSSGSSSSGSTGSGTGGTSTPPVSSSSKNYTEYSLPFDATWQPDLFGRIRNTIKSNVYAAQASAADLENIRLSVQAELALDYFQLRGQDAQVELFDSTVKAYQQSLELTKALYETGIDSDESVAQAETQLEAAQATDTNLGIARAQFEHAIAMLIGQPASNFSLPPEPLKPGPPAIPFGLPSQLLERRPDIAANERLVAQANAQIGVARAAYYPTVTLTGSAGLVSTSISDWFTWPSRFWSVGPSLAETLFDAGLRRATVQQYRAQYDEAVANYRQTVLTAFQQVEDNLAALRLLSKQIEQQDAAVKSAERNLSLAADRYKLGIDPYLNVITAQTTLLTNQQTAVSLRQQQMTASVQLIEALGGGWDASQLPSLASDSKAFPNR